VPSLKCKGNSGILARFNYPTSSLYGIPVQSLTFTPPVPPSAPNMDCGSFPDRPGNRSHTRLSSCQACVLELFRNALHAAKLSDNLIVAPPSVFL